MKKSLIFLGTLLLASLLLIGCGGSQTPPAVQDQSGISDSEDLPGQSEEISPIYANQIADGTYPIEVSSTSSMFRIIDAKLIVAGGEMSALITLSGTGYEKLYMGSGEEALVDSDDKCIYFEEDADGKYTYKVPVVALNEDIDCAAWSIRKQEWYDRVLVFKSDLIPEGAIKTDLALAPISEGVYLIDVTLSGGTGRAKIKSPTTMTVTANSKTALIEWTSPYYEHILLAGDYYYPINGSGNSVFEIPVTTDADIAITAQTIAMSQPHEIDYVLYFDGGSIRPYAGD